VRQQITLVSVVVGLIAEAQEKYARLVDSHPELKRLGDNGGWRLRIAGRSTGDYRRMEGRRLDVVDTRIRGHRAARWFGCPWQRFRLRAESKGQALR
jgi:hypothetical protein